MASSNREHTPRSWVETASERSDGQIKHEYNGSPPNEASLNILTLLAKSGRASTGQAPAGGGVAAHLTRGERHYVTAS